MKRVLLLSSAAFCIALAMGFAFTVDRAVAPEAQLPLTAKGMKVATVQTPDGHSLFGIPHDEPTSITMPEPLPKMVALTFDDGPNVRYTPHVLEILNRTGIHATFFLVGDQVVNAPLLAAQVAEYGHQIGNHSFLHIAYKNRKDVEQDRKKTDAVILDATGITPHVYRPPFGVTTPAQLSGSGLPTIRWSIDARDWVRTRTVDDIVSDVLTQVHPGAVILLHDTNERTVQSLPRIIEGLRARGYDFQTVDQLFGFSDPVRWHTSKGIYFNYSDFAHLNAKDE